MIKRTTKRKKLIKIAETLVAVEREREREREGVFIDLIF